MTATECGSGLPDTEKREDNGGIRKKKVGGMAEEVDLPRSFCLLEELDVGLGLILIFSYL